eukprot:366417-Chlamydomonas_euryale.AAC.32
MPTTCPPKPSGKLAQMRTKSPAGAWPNRPFSASSFATLFPAMPTLLSLARTAVHTAALVNKTLHHLSTTCASSSRHIPPVLGCELRADVWAAGGAQLAKLTKQQVSHSGPQAAMMGRWAYGKRRSPVGLIPNAKPY